MLRLAAQAERRELAAKVRRHAAEERGQRTIDEQRHASLARAGRRVGRNDLRGDRIDVGELGLAQERSARLAWRFLGALRRVRRCCDLGQVERQPRPAQRRPLRAETCAASNRHRLPCSHALAAACLQVMLQSPGNRNGPAGTRHAQGLAIVGALPSRRALPAAQPWNLCAQVFLKHRERTIELSRCARYGDDPCPRDPGPARAGRRRPLPLPPQQQPPKPEPTEVTATHLERREIPSFSESREARIAEAAYWRAERRGFTAGQELDDWLAAEKEVDGATSRNAPRRR